MRLLILFTILPVLTWAALVQSIVQLHVEGNPVTGLKIIQQTLGELGYKLEIEKFSAADEGFHAKCTIVGHKPFNAEVLLQNLQAHQIKVVSAKKISGGVELSLNTRYFQWQANPLGADEGSELQKTSSPYWFSVQPEQKISIQPPFGVKWYPDIAVFDENFVLLYERRDSKPSNEIEFVLPSGAKYLKVSNMEGMKLLKEGTWVESSSLGR